MRKIGLVFICTLFFSIYSFGQFSKGSIMAGGNVSANFSTNKTISGSTTTTNFSSDSFSFRPQVGYFFIDKLAGGAGLQFSTSSSKADGSPNKSSQTSFSFEPFARYYFDKFYAQGGIGFGSFKSESTSGTTTFTSKGSIFNWSLLGGYVILLNDHVALEPQIGYQSNSSTQDGSNLTNKTAGLFLQLGIQVYIHK